MSIQELRDAVEDEDPFFSFPGKESSSSRRNGNLTFSPVRRRSSTTNTHQKNRSNREKSPSSSIREKTPSSCPGFDDSASFSPSEMRLLGSQPPPGRRDQGNTNSSSSTDPFRATGNTTRNLGNTEDFPWRDLEVSTTGNANYQNASFQLDDSDDDIMFPQELERARDPASNQRRANSPEERKSMTLGDGAIERRSITIGGTGSEDLGGDFEEEDDKLIIMGSFGEPAYYSGGSQWTNMFGTGGQARRSDGFELADATETHMGTRITHRRMGQIMKDIHFDDEEDELDLILSHWTPAAAEAQKKRSKVVMVLKWTCILFIILLFVFFVLLLSGNEWAERQKIEVTKYGRERFNMGYNTVSGVLGVSSLDSSKEKELLEIKGVKHDIVLPGVELGLLLDDDKDKYNKDKKYIKDEKSNEKFIKHNNNKKEYNKSSIVGKDVKMEEKGDSGKSKKGDGKKNSPLPPPPSSLSAKQVPPPPAKKPMPEPPKKNPRDIPGTEEWQYEMFKKQKPGDPHPRGPITPSKRVQQIFKERYDRKNKSINKKLVSKSLPLQPFDLDNPSRLDPDNSPQPETDPFINPDTGLADVVNFGWKTEQIDPARAFENESQHVMSLCSGRRMSHSSSSSELLKEFVLYVITTLPSYKQDCITAFIRQFGYNRIFENGNIRYEKIPGIQHPNIKWGGFEPLVFYYPDVDERKPEAAKGSSGSPHGFALTHDMGIQNNEKNAVKVFKALETSLSADSHNVVFYLMEVEREEVVSTTSMKNTLSNNTSSTTSTSSKTDKEEIENHVIVFYAMLGLSDLQQEKTDPKKSNMLTPNVKVPIGGGVWKVQTGITAHHHDVCVGGMLGAFDVMQELRQFGVFKNHLDRTGRNELRYDTTLILDASWSYKRQGMSSDEWLERSFQIRNSFLNMEGYELVKSGESRPVLTLEGKPVKFRSDRNGLIHLKKKLDKNLTPEEKMRVRYDILENRFTPGKACYMAPHLTGKKVYSQMSRYVGTVNKSVRLFKNEFQTPKDDLQGLVYSPDMNAQGYYPGMIHYLYRYPSLTPSDYLTYGNTLTKKSDSISVKLEHEAREKKRNEILEKKEHDAAILRKAKYESEIQEMERKKKEVEGMLKKAILDDQEVEIKVKTEELRKLEQKMKQLEDEEKKREKDLKKGKDLTITQAMRKYFETSWSKLADYYGIDSKTGEFGPIIDKKTGQPRKLSLTDIESGPLKHMLIPTKKLLDDKDNNNKDNKEGRMGDDTMNNPQPALSKPKLVKDILKDDFPELWTSKEDLELQSNYGWVWRNPSDPGKSFKNLDTHMEDLCSGREGTHNGKLYVLYTIIGIRKFKANCWRKFKYVFGYDSHKTKNGLLGYLDFHNPSYTYTSKANNRKHPKLRWPGFEGLNFYFPNVDPDNPEVVAGMVGPKHGFAPGGGSIPDNSIDQDLILQQMELGMFGPQGVSGELQDEHVENTVYFWLVEKSLKKEESGEPSTEETEFHDIIYYSQFGLGDVQSEHNERTKKAGIVKHNNSWFGGKEGGKVNSGGGVWKLQVSRIAHHDGMCQGAIYESFHVIEELRRSAFKAKDMHHPTNPGKSFADYHKILILDASWSYKLDSMSVQDWLTKTAPMRESMLNMRGLTRIKTEWKDDSDNNKSRKVLMSTHKLDSIRSSTGGAEVKGYYSKLSDPGYLVLPGEEPNQVSKGAIEKRKISNAWTLNIGDPEPLENDGYAMLKRAEILEGRDTPGKMCYLFPQMSGDPRFQKLTRMHGITDNPISHYNGVDYPLNLDQQGLFPGVVYYEYHLEENPTPYDYGDTTSEELDSETINNLRDNEGLDNADPYVDPLYRSQQGPLGADHPEDTDDEWDNSFIHDDTFRQGGQYVRGGTHFGDMGTDFGLGSHGDHSEEFGAHEAHRRDGGYHSAQENRIRQQIDKQLAEEAKLEEERQILSRRKGFIDDDAFGDLDMGKLGQHVDDLDWQDKERLNLNKVYNGYDPYLDKGYDPYLDKGYKGYDPYQDDPFGTGMGVDPYHPYGSNYKDPYVQHDPYGGNQYTSNPYGQNANTNPNVYGRAGHQPWNAPPQQKQTWNAQQKQTWNAQSDYANQQQAQHQAWSAPSQPLERQEYTQPFHNSPKKHGKQQKKSDSQSFDASIGQPSGR